MKQWNRKEEKTRTKLNAAQHINRIAERVFWCTMKMHVNVPSSSLDFALPIKVQKNSHFSTYAMHAFAPYFINVECQWKILFMLQAFGAICSCGIRRNTKCDRMFCLFWNDSNNNKNVCSIVYEMTMILVELSEVTHTHLCVHKHTHLCYYFYILIVIIII